MYAANDTFSANPCHTCHLPKETLQCTTALVHLHAVYRTAEFSLADRVLRAKEHHCTIRHQNRSSGCGDIGIFPFFKMAAVRHLGFICRISGPPTKHI